MQYYSLAPYFIANRNTCTVSLLMSSWKPPISCLPGSQPFNIPIPSSQSDNSIYLMPCYKDSSSLLGGAFLIAFRANNSV
mmetsp:Transcript_3857/g.5864  ORF Transcript_3857/g.5864 Transcript_3857/m.5864 type:complete len:80 (+) Transcript_3857:408-647(+)